ncbi:MAG: hypothetical protein ABL951_04380 [Alphaproteobacteria bacterium]
MVRAAFSPRKRWRSGSSEIPMRPGKAFNVRAETWPGHADRLRFGNGSQQGRYRRALGGERGLAPSPLAGEDRGEGAKN